jgi:hypothetical protein
MEKQLPVARCQLPEISKCGKSMLQREDRLRPVSTFKRLSSYGRLSKAEGMGESARDGVVRLQGFCKDQIGALLVRPQSDDSRSAIRTHKHRGGGGAGKCSRIQPICPLFHQFSK